MTSGVFAISRGIFEHPFFAEEALTEREAWIWLIREAAWRERTTRAGKAVVDLKRGECAHSIRFMAEAWGWHRSRVQRFLERLKIETMIGTRIETGVTVISISNYDEYQKVSLPSKTPEETQAETLPRQKRDKQESIKNIEDTTPDTRANLDTLETRLRGAAGPSIDSSAVSLCVLSDPLAWLKAGADLDADILPTLRARTATARPGSIRSWAYYSQAIADARDRRLRGLPAAIPIPIKREQKNEPSLSAHARNLTERLRAAEQGESLWSIRSEPGGGDSVRLLSDGRSGRA